MKKSIVILTVLFVFFSSAVLFFLGNKIKIKNYKKDNVFVSNPAIASLVKAIVGSEFDVEILGSYSENFHQHNI